MNSTTALRLVMAMTASLATGCGDDDGGGGGSGGGSTGSEASTSATSDASTSATSGGAAGGGVPGCDRGILEEDLAGGTSDQPLPLVWLGPGADPETGELLDVEGELVASTTYLQLQTSPEAQQRFGELMSPIIGALFTNPELVAVQLGTSASCGTARTYTVWRSIEGMVAFATSDAHMEAVGAVGEVSRGGSVVTHWEGATVDSLDWDEATRRIAEDEGPFY